MLLDDFKHGSEMSISKAWVLVLDKLEIFAKARLIKMGVKPLSMYAIFSQIPSS